MKMKEERNKKNDTHVKMFFNGRKWFISHMRGNGGEKFLGLLNFEDPLEYNYTVYVQIFEGHKFCCFAGNLSSTKFKSSKFYKTVIIHLKHKV